jgi:hypothetical protein
MRLCRQASKLGTIICGHVGCWAGCASALGWLVKRVSVPSSKQQRHPARRNLDLDYLSLEGAHLNLKRKRPCWLVTMPTTLCPKHTTSQSFECTIIIINACMHLSLSPVPQPSIQSLTNQDPIPTTHTHTHAFAPSSHKGRKVDTISIDLVLV